MNYRTITLAVTLIALTLVGCSDSDNSANESIDAGAAVPGTANIVETAVEADGFSTLVAALQVTGLDVVLADESREFTVFAPTDAAFAELGQDTIDSLLADPDTLRNILLYHVIADQTLDSATATSFAGNTVPAANGDTLSITLDGARLFINMSEVIAPDVAATNGVIHAIDSVLLPSVSEPAQDSAPLNIVDTALAAGSFTTLVAALDATDLTSVLADESATFTVFAPTDDAFAALGQDTINALLADPAKLSDILLYHVIAEQAVDANAATALAGTTVSMANGDDVAISLDNGELRVNQARVTTTDIVTSNGIIHVIDAVLTPPEDAADPATLLNLVETAQAAGDFTTLLAALQATGLDTVLANANDTYTVFAPNDAAFAQLGEETINALLADPDTLRDILLYHVIAGSQVDSTTALSLAGSDVNVANGDTVRISLDGDRLLVNVSEVIATDIQASNGVIHVIDAVLLPPADTDNDTGEPLQNLLDTARDAGDFTVLLAALEATGLDVAIGHGNDLYTVFAPTDQAFAALGQDTIDALLADPVSLRNILLYHVVAGTAIDGATALSKVGVSIEAANGDRFTLRLEDDALFINDSRIIATDIRASNGIIHVIDAVLIPPSR